MDQTNKENLETPEKRIKRPDEETRFDWDKEREKHIEKKEISSYEENVSAELRREIDLMEADEKTKEEAEKKAKKIEFLGEKEKIEHLLEIAREKGVVFAINVCRKMNEPYLLDVLHDILAKEGFYKDFTK